mmetsp:Transcript_26786/g.43533  ORF Transcript_26786/g.43533 Transcript_26786/m.43533 type:complete len:109 (-) Transcript_26786:265-591(-)
MDVERQHPQVPHKRPNVTFPTGNIQLLDDHVLLPSIRQRNSALLHSLLEISNRKCLTVLTNHRSNIDDSEIFKHVKTLKRLEGRRFEVIVGGKDGDDCCITTNAMFGI